MTIDDDYYFFIFGYFGCNDLVRVDLLDQVEFDTFWLYFLLYNR